MSDKPNRKERVCCNCHHSCATKKRTQMGPVRYLYECRLNPPVKDVSANGYSNDPNVSVEYKHWVYPKVQDSNPACSHFRPSFESLLVPKEEQTETKTILDEIREYFGL